MYLEIGPLKLSLDLVADATLRAQLAQILGAFMRPRVSGADHWQLRFGRVLEPHKREGGIEFTVDEGSFNLQYTMYEARGPWPGPGTVTATVVHQEECAKHEVDWIIGVLRVLVTELLRRQAHLVFHGAAVQLTNGLGVLAVGPRAQGKTTFALGPWVQSRWSDDHGVVRVAGEPSLIGVPFTGRERSKTHPGSSPLNLIIIPEPAAVGAAPALTPCETGQAMEFLIKNLICVDPRLDTFDANMNMLGRLVERTPVYRLCYHKGTPKEELITALSAVSSSHKLAS